MKTLKLDEKIIEIEIKGFKNNGGTIACPQVGGDHECELWVHPKSEYTAEVCRYCQTVHIK